MNIPEIHVKMLIIHLRYPPPPQKKNIKVVTSYTKQKCVRLIFITAKNFMKISQISFSKSTCLIDIDIYKRICSWRYKDLLLKICKPIRVFR